MLLEHTDSEICIARLSSEHLFISDMHAIVKYTGSNGLTSSLTETHQCILSIGREHVFEDKG